MSLAASASACAAPFGWRAIAISICAVVMLLPMRAYQLPVSFGFALEPYRIVLAGVAVLVVARMLVYPDRRALRLVYGREMAIFIAAVVLSIGWNAASVAVDGNASLVLGNFANLVVFLGVFVLMRVLVRSAVDVHAVIAALVLAGGVVGAAAVWERASGVNVFDHLGSYLPFLELLGPREQVVRDGAVRAMASAQHPIALCAVLSLLLPIGIWLSVRGEWPRRSWRPAYALCTMAITCGIAASGSRTGMMTLVAMAIVLLVLRPRLLVRAVLPALVIIAVVVELLMVPGSISATLAGLAPDGGLVAEQTGQAGTTGGGRLGDLATVSAYARDHPFAGVGFGSRVFTGDRVNALILDNEYLGRLVEQGVTGLLAFVLLVASPIVRSAIGTRRRDVGFADLHLALACAFGSFAASLAVFDGLSFLQAAIMFFMLLAISAAITDLDRDSQETIWR